ncbi:MAG TPA: hypothetical protein VNO50_10900 [Pyrinomonadaceae bacterium]|nr:hypothetical protein [Pyrinomonadaceae bacterium]
MKSVWFFINGILSWPSAADGWTDQAVTWVHRNTEDGRGEKFEYAAGALTRRLLQQERAERFTRKLLCYMNDREPWRIHLVAHSNGADIALRMLDLLPGTETRLRTLHLVAPACDASFETNGLNRHLKDYRLERVFVHWATADKAMQMAQLSRRFIGWTGFGYGDLGRQGPQNVTAEVEARVAVIPYLSWGHSEFWTDKRFEGFMASLHRLTDNRLTVYRPE